MKRFRSNDLLTSIALIVIGGMFIVYKNEVISIAMSLIGCTLLALGIIDLVRRLTASGILKIISGLFVLVAGWAMVTLVLYFLGAFLIFAGATQLYAILSIKIEKITLPVIIHIAQPTIYLLAGICLFFNQGGALSWVFTVSGLFFLVDGVIGLIGAIGDEK